MARGLANLALLLWTESPQPSCPLGPPSNLENPLRILCPAIRCRELQADPSPSYEQLGVEQHLGVVLVAGQVRI
jgi:hypothetical protein